MCRQQREHQIRISKMSKSSCVRPDRTVLKYDALSTSEGEVHTDFARGVGRHGFNDGYTTSCGPPVAHLKTGKLTRFVVVGSATNNPTGALVVYCEIA